MGSPKDWDYWDKKHHDDHHAEKSTGCMGLLFQMLAAFIIGTPLVLVALDFWRALACTKYQICPPQLIEWYMGK